MQSFKCTIDPPQFEPKAEPLDVQTTEPQDLDSLLQPQLVKEEGDQQKSISNSPEAEVAPLDVRLDKESPLSLEAALPNELSSSHSHMSKHKYQIEETTSSECSWGKSAEPAGVSATPVEVEEKDEIDDATKMKEEAFKDPSDEAVPLCGHPSTSKPAESPQTTKLEAEQKLTKNDRQIIEKIRSYYEAAETESGVEDAQLTRRNSFSHIPTGLVKDSVSRFNVFVHQVSQCDSESGKSDCYENDTMSPQLPEQSENIFSQPDSSSAAHAVSPSGQGRRQSESKSDDEQICDFKPRMELWKEKERKADGLKVSTCVEGSFARDKEACARDQASMKEKKTCVLHEHLSSEQDHADGRKPSSPQETKKTSKIFPAGTRDKISSNCNLDNLPSQIKVGHFSRHDKVGTCSRTLYEGMPDVPGLGFFEGGPVDQCLVENSEKIMSKVQMLARMYTAKASSMKVPLHQKRTRGPWVAPSKVNTPLVSEVLLHQADEKQLSGEYPLAQFLF